MLVRLRAEDDRDIVVQKLVDEGVDCRRGRWPNMARLHLLPKDFEQSREAITQAIKIAEGRSHH
jgi:hypothetical protein